MQPSLLAKDRKYAVICVAALLLLMLPTLLKAQVVLGDYTNPTVAQAGVQNVKVTGTGFPTDLISVSDVSVVLTPVPSGTSVSTTPLVLTQYNHDVSLRFLVPASINVTTPTLFTVSVSGKSANGTTFTTSEPSWITINPASSITLSPNQATVGSQLWVNIAGTLTDFSQYGTFANFGPGISVSGGTPGQTGAIDVSTVVVAKALVDIDDTAAPGSRNVVVNTGPQQASASFLVLAPYQPPTADAGPQQLVAVGTSVQLDGSRSTSPAGNPLTFSWSLTSVPSGSRATVSNSAIVNPTFVADTFGQYTAQLTVSDGVSSTSASVIITTSNTAPVANAGADQSVATGSVVTLDGSGSSDVDGDSLTYIWTLKQKPQGSTAQLSSASSITPTFVADVSGTYIAELTINDGHGHSATKSVSVSTSNQPPVVNPGPGQTVPVATLVQLDGSGSSDPDGDSLSYAWTFTFRPSGSSAVISADSSAFPTFTPDVRGNYVVQLTIDDGHGHTASSTVTISTANSAPIANAGSPQNVEVGATVSLDGSASVDPDGSSLFYTWSLLARPAGSNATLSGTAVAAPQFVADVAGQYVAQLIVSDGTLLSTPVTVLITAAGTSMSVNPPVVDFGTLSLTRTVTRSIIITNTGGTPLQITGVTVAGNASSQFQTTSAAIPTVVAPGASTTVNVAYAPTATGNQSASVVINTTAAPQTTVPLVAAAVSGPSISYSPGQINFGDQTVGRSSAFQKVTIGNLGPGDYIISSLTFGGVAKQDYSAVVENSSVAFTERPTRGDVAALTSNFTPIPAGSSVVVDVSFTPTASGQRPATLIITDNSNSNPQVILLSGNGLASGISFTPTSLSFGSQALNSTSSPFTVNVNNTGTSALTVSAITVLGTNASDFTILSPATPFTVAPGAAKPVTLTFTPGASGDRSATLSFSDDATGSPHSVNLAGTGGTSAPQISVQPTGIDFGTVILNTAKTSNIAISNPGSGPLSVTSIAILGANAADFAVSSPALPLTIQAGSSANIPVTFVPSALNARNAVVAISHNAGGSPAQVTLTGVGSNQPNPISPTSLDFGNQLVGTTSVDKTVTFTNYSASNATINSFTISGASAAEFTVTGPATPITVPSSGTVNLTVKFAPSAQGTRNATLAIANSLPGSPHNVSLTGNGTQPAITVAPPSLTFAAQQKTTTSAPQTITVTNPGTGDLVISNIAISGTNALEFSFTPNTFPITVGPSGTKQISVTFTPSDIGSRTATLTLTHNAGTGTSSVSLTGTGQNGSTTIQISPTAVDFGLVATNIASTQKFVNVTNNGGTNLVISGITITGANASEFTFSAPPLPVTIGPFSTISVGVTATPTAVGVRTASLSFADNAAGSPHTVTLSATGKGTPAFSTSPSTVDFGKQNVGSASAPLTLTINNPGTDNLVITALSFTGANATDFSINPAATLPLTVAANGSATLSLKFTPAASGARTASLRVTNNTTGSPNSISITGIGTVAVLTTTAPGDFGSVPSTTTSPAKTAVLTNSGTGVLTISALSITGTNAAEFALVTPPALPITIQPGANVNLSVTFTPASTGARTASISITDDAAGSPHSIALSGTGSANGPGISFAPSSVPFGNQPLNQTTAATSLTVTNTGNQTLNITAIQLAGANAGDFAIVPPSLPAAVNAGSSIVVQVTFKPTAAGARAAQVTFTDNVSGGPQSVQLSGTGISTQISANPTSLTFADQSVGTASVAKTVTITNPAAQPVSIIGLPISGTNASSFSLTNAPSFPAAIAAGGTLTLNVVFSPTSVTSGLAATLTVISNNGGSVPVALSGNGIQSSNASVSFNTTALAFPNTNLNQSSAAKPVIVNSTGNGNLVVSSVTITGANASDFTFTGPTFPATISPQSSTVLSVTFKPTDLGARTATMTVVDNAAGSPHTITLSGSGTINGPAIRLNPSAFTFATQNVGVPSASQPLTITNPGTTALSITALTFSGANASDFSFGSVTLPMTVAAGGSATLNLVFNPTAEGARSATLTFTDNAPSSPTHAVTLSGSGLSPKATLTPGSQNFGSVQVNQTSAPTTFTITNTGTVTVVVSSISSSNPAFQISSVQLPITIAAGSTSTFNVTFAPTVGGNASGTLTVNSNAPAVTAALTGVSPSGAFSVAPTSIDFGNQAVGTTSTSRSAVITNTASSVLTISAISLSAPNAGDFLLSTPALPITIPAGQNAQINVSFKPTTTGLSQSSLSFVDSASGTPHSLPLTGTGTAPVIAAQMLPATFPDQATNTTSAPSNLQISNSGNADLIVSSITINGTGAAAFQIPAGGVTLPLTVAPGASVNVPITFKPTGVQTYSASASVVSNSAASPMPVPLSGKGIAMPNLTVSPAAGLAFGNQVITTTSAPLTLNLGNTGAGTLTISNLAITGPNAADFTIVNNVTLPISLPASTGQTSIQITYKPTVIAPGSATLVVTSNMPSSPTNIPLSGAGVGTPKIQLPASVVFGNQLVGSTSAASPLVINNTGSADLVISNITMNGTTPGDFSITTGTLPITIASGASVSLDTKFTPSGTGSRGAMVTITHNGSNVASPTQVPLNGTGVQPTLVFNPPGGVPQSTMSFGSVVAGSSANLSLVVGNTGTADLVINTLTISGAQAADYSFGTVTLPLTVTAGQQKTLTITFSPKGNGTRTATLTFGDNAAGNPHSITLSGQGQAPAIVISPSTQPVDFGASLVNATVTKTISVSNNGSGPLNVTALTLTGAQAGDYSITAGPAAPFTVQQGVTVPFTVSFKPTAAGTRTATLSFTSNSPTSPDTVALTGLGQTQVKIDVAPSPVVFSNQSVNVASNPVPVTITSSGSADLVISSLSVTGAQASEFVATLVGGQQLPLTLTPGSTATVNIVFTPTVANARLANLVITSNAPTSPTSVALQGNAVGIPVPNFNPASLDFGNIKTGSTSAPLPLTISNSGSADLVIQGVSLIGANASDFNLPGVSTPLVIQPGASSTINLTFTAGALGARTAQIRFTDNAPGSPHTVNIGGTGTLPGISVNPTSFDFGNQAKSVASTAKTFTVSNPGTADLVISAITPTGTNASDFTVTGATFPMTITAGNSNTFGIVFTPAAAGARSASVNILHNAPGSVTNVPLTGNGVVSAVTLTPAVNSTLTFPGVIMGQSGTPQTVTLQNTGGGQLVVSSIVTQGSQASDFTVNATLPLSIDPGQSAQITVTFTPGGAIPATRTASLKFTDNAPDSPQLLQLSGTALKSKLSVDKTTLDFQNQNVNTPSPAKTVTITNTGTANLNVTGFSFTGANPADFAFTSSPLPISLAPNATTVVSVTFTPAAKNSRTATLNIANDTDVNPVTVALTGTGAAPTWSSTPQPQALSFPDQINTQASAPLPITINNTGNGNLVISNISITGANASEFSFTSNPLPLTVLPSGQGSVTVGVIFNPTADGQKTANIVITANDDPNPHTYTLTGKGVSPQISVAPSVVFDPTNLNSTSTKPLVIANNGTGNLVVNSLTFTGTNAAEFTQSGVTLPTTIAPGTNKTFTITFAPQGANNRTATLSIVDNSLGSPHTVAISGTGVAPQFSPSPNPLDFGGSATTKTLPVVITNTGNGNLVINTMGAASTNNPTANEWSASIAPSSLPLTVTPGSTATVNVTYTPLASGARTGTLTFTDNAPGSPHSIPLTATYTGPGVSLDRTSIDFGTVKPPQSSSPQAIKITNNGGSNLVITAIALAGSNPGDFLLSGKPTLPATVTPGNFISMSAIFKPTTTGPRSAQISITDNALGSPHTVALAGTGQPNVTLVMPNITIGKDLETLVTVGTSTSVTQDLVVTITSADSNQVVLSSDPSVAGTGSVTVTVPAGSQTGFPGFYVQGLVASGATTLTVTAPNVPTLNNVQVAFTGSGFQLSSPNGIGANFTNVLGNGDSTLGVSVVRLDAGGNIVSGNYKIRGGLSVVVPVTATDVDPASGVGSIIGTATLSGGMSVTNAASFHPVNPGQSTIAITQPGGFSTPPSGTSLTATVRGPSITLNPVTVGANLEIGAVGILEAPAGPGGVQITITSTNPSAALVSSTAQGSGSSSIVLAVPQGSVALPPFYVFGVSTGSSTLTATATGYAAGSGQVAVTSSGFLIAGPSGNAGEAFSTSTISPNTPIKVSVVRLDPGGNVAGDGVIRGGFSTQVTVLSSNGSVATVSGNPITFSAGMNSLTGVFLSPVGQGTTVLSVAPVAGFSTPNSGGTVVATVSQPQVQLSLNSTTIGSNLQIAASGRLTGPAPSPNLQVTITSNNSNVLLSTNPAAAGSTSITLTIPSGGGVDGNAFPSFYVQAAGAAGTSATLTASAPNFQGDTQTVTVTPSGFVLFSPNGMGADFGTISSEGNTNLNVVAMQLVNGTNAPAHEQAVRGGLAFNVAVTSSNSGPGTVSDSPAPFSGGVSEVIRHFTPGATKGTTNLQITQPPGFTVPSAGSSLNAVLN